MFRAFLAIALLVFLFASSLSAMDQDNAAELTQRGNSIQLLRRSDDKLEAVLGAGNNVLLKMSMNLNFPKVQLDKEPLEVPVRLFLTDFLSLPTTHPTVDLKVKVDWESTPLTCVLPNKPQSFDNYGQFTDWLNQGYFMNKVMIAYDFHIDIQKSAPSLAQHLFSLPPKGYLFRGTHAVENSFIKPEQCIPQVTYCSQRGTVNATVGTLKGTFYLNNQPYPIDDHQQIFPHPMIEQKVLKRDQTKKFYHHRWLAQSQLTIMESYEEFPRNQINEWPKAPSETYSLLRLKLGDLKEICHIACSDGITGESLEILDGKVFLIDVENIKEKSLEYLESIVIDEKGKFFIMRYLYPETPKEKNNLESLEEEAERLAIAEAAQREKLNVEKKKAGEAVKQNVENLKKQLGESLKESSASKQNIEELKAQLEATQKKVDEIQEYLIKAREAEILHHKEKTERQEIKRQKTEKREKQQKVSLWDSGIKKTIQNVKDLQNYELTYDALSPLLGEIKSYYTPEQYIKICIQADQTLDIKGLTMILSRKKELGVAVDISLTSPQFQEAASKAYTFLIQNGRIERHVDERGMAFRKMRREVADNLKKFVEKKMEKYEELQGTTHPLRIEYSKLF